MVQDLLRGRAVVLGAAIVVGLIVVAAVVVMRLDVDESSSEPIGLDPAQPDSTVSSDETRAWSARALADARRSGVTAIVLVPLFVLASEGQTFVWIRDYESGDQVMAQYAGIDPGAARLIRIDARSAKTVGASAWELDRIGNAIAGDQAVQAAVGAPVVLVRTSIAQCAGGSGACARVALSGSRLSAPADGPALAPVAVVDLRSLNISLVLP